MYYVAVRIHVIDKVQSNFLKLYPQRALRNGAEVKTCFQLN